MTFNPVYAGISCGDASRTTPVGTANLIWQFNLGRLAYQSGQLSVKQPLIALQVQLLLDLPIVESNPIRRLALFAKQMDEQLWFESTALRL
jgi:hypothetical protein